MRLAAVTLALALLPALVLAGSCKKDSPKGLPPAGDWSAAGAGSAPAASDPGAAPANPHGGGNPHAGVDMSGGAGANPHAGVDMSGGAGANPHAGVDMSGGDMMPEKTAPRTLEKLPDGRFALGPYSVAIPAGWKEKPVTSKMREADLLLPGAAGTDAELVVYYFGSSGAGSVQANLDRWVDQIQQPDGKPSKDVAKIEKATYAGQEATIVSVSGRYVATSMPGGGDSIDKADQTLVAAIVASPKGPYYFKLVGAKKTIDAESKNLRAMLASLKLR